MLKNAMKMNLEDLWPFLVAEGGVFLVYELIEAILLLAVKPDTSGAICGVVLLAVGVMMNLFAGCGYPLINVDLLLRYSVTRRTALWATLGSMALNVTASMAFAALLGWVDGLIARAWVNTLPWVVDVESVTLPLWAYFAAGLGVVCVALGVGSLLLRFGRKAFWITWGLWMVLAVGLNMMDWHALNNLNASVVAAAAAAVCLGSLLGGSALILRANVKN